MEANLNQENAEGTVPEASAPSSSTDNNVTPSFTARGIPIPFYSTSSVAPQSPVLGWIAKFLSGEDIREFMTIDTLKDLCTMASEVLKAESNVLNLSCEEGNLDDKWVVVGDIHGQFEDLVYHVLGQQRRTGEEKVTEKKFLFLGDYVDRGPRGLDVIALLLCLKVAYQDKVFIIRGNHEEATTSRMYGFFYECRTKFGDGRIWSDFNEVFGVIPLAATIQSGKHKAFFVHGGLSPNLSMVECINFIERNEYGGNLDDGNSEVVDGLLWSDPAGPDVAGFLHNDRGCGFAFGENTTEEFCYRNGLDFICRAHQMVQAGYQWCHANKLLTIFSAPNYCGMSNNLGAILLLLTGSWETELVQYDVAPKDLDEVADPEKLPGKYFTQNEDMS